LPRPSKTSSPVSGTSSRGQSEFERLLQMPLGPRDPYKRHGPYNRYGERYNSERQRKAFIPRQAKPEFGRKPGYRPLPGPVPGSRVLPLVGGILAAGELADALIPYAHPYPQRVLGDEWVLVNDCGTRPAWAHYDFRSGTISNCAAGQVPGPLYGEWPGVGEALSVAVGVGYGTLFLANATDPPLRFRNDMTWNRVTTDATTVEIVNQPVGWAPDPIFNPNDMRFNPPKTLQPPVVEPAEDPYWILEVSNAPPTQPPRPTPKKPPRPRVKERKSRVAKWYFRAWQFLDDLSELSEIIASFYNALPEEIIEATKCNELDRSFDQWGQYGIGGADCMLAALYNHWDKVDPGLAVLNMARNSLQDDFYGLLYKYVPQPVMSLIGASVHQLKPGEVGFQQRWNEMVEKAIDFILYGRLPQQKE